MGKLHLKLQAPLRSKIPLDLAVDLFFPREQVRDLIPSVIASAESKIKRSLEREQQLALSNTIRHVDGSKHVIDKADREKSYLQPKQEEKLENQFYIRRLKYQELIHSEIVMFFSTATLPKILLKPMWRITRVEASPDLRHYYAYWIIDNDPERFAYKIEMEHKFLTIDPQLRFYLSKKINSKFTPAIKFRYEEYD